MKKRLGAIGLYKRMLWMPLTEHESNDDDLEKMETKKKIKRKEIVAIARSHNEERESRDFDTHWTY